MAKAVKSNVSHESDKEARSAYATDAGNAIAAAVIVFVFLAVVDQTSARLGLTGVQRLADDLLGGVIVGTISFVDERRRNRYLAARLRVIALMNHHVRNSLQTIKFAQHTNQQVQVIDDAVARIEWALREVLPQDINGAKETPVAWSSQPEAKTKAS